MAAHHSENSGLGIRHQSLLSAVPWEGDRLAFVKTAYARHLAVDSPLIDFLEARGEAIRRPELEKFRDRAIYAFPADTRGVDPGQEDRILAALLDLNPVYFESLMASTPLPTAGQALEKKDPFHGKTPEDIWLECEYREFLKEKYMCLYDPMGLPPFEVLADTCQNIFSQDQWTGDAQEYINRLHDEGYIFLDQGYRNIERLGLKRPEYAPDGWAVQFYEHWIKEGLWTLGQAIDLFKGQGSERSRPSVVPGFGAG